MEKETAVLFSEAPDKLYSVYGEQERALLEKRFHLKIVTDKESLFRLPELSSVTYLFSTWGMPRFTPEEIARLPRLTCVFYAAGSVQGFAREFLQAGVKVFSAWAANAVPVAEYATSQILLANKGFFSCSLLAKKGRRQEAAELFSTYRGNYGQPVGLLGAGMIGKLVIEHLKKHRLEILVFDPFLPEEKAAELGVTKASLETIFSRCTVVSNHLANNPQTVGMLNYSLFSRMPKNGVFINTGRGAQVVEADLCRALTEEPYRFAVLDVTWPEPPEPGHPFYTLENVLLTPHIAGSAGDETRRMAEYMLEEQRRYSAGEPVRYEVTESMLATMA